VKYEKYGLITLTAKGRHLAVDVLRRHRIVEQFLVQIVGLDWSEVHAEAERLEHAISPMLLDRLDAMLGRPDVDPHGDPIPRPAQRSAAVSVQQSRGLRLSTGQTGQPLVPLAQCLPGQRVKVARITDQQSPFLRFLASIGVKPGVKIEIIEVDPARDIVRLVVADDVGSFAGRSESLGCTPAGRVLTCR
jgi:DtxR family Mn-dependent transcriptional regulator